MKLFATNVRSPIGIDIGARTIKAVQGARGSKGWRAESAVVVPRLRPGEAIDGDEIARLADVLYRRGFRGRQIVLAVPPLTLLSSMLELPPGGDDVPLEQIARMELARVHQREADSFEFAQWEIPAPARGARATHVMAVACPHESASALLDVFEGRGFVVRALDVQLCAAARACAPLVAAADAKGMCALLDLGWSGCRLAILHNGVVVYSRALDGAGFESLSRTLQQRMQIPVEVAQQILDEGGLSMMPKDDTAPDDSWPEARPHLIEHLDEMLKELQVSFSYVSHQYPDAALQRLFLIGGGAAVPGLGEHIADRLEISVEVVNPSALVDCNPDPICRSATIVTAMGLAQYEESDER